MAFAARSARPSGARSSCSVVWCGWPTSCSPAWSSTPSCTSSPRPSSRPSAFARPPCTWHDRDDATCSASHATVGENPEYDHELFARPVPPHVWDELFLERYQIGSSYFIDHRRTSGPRSSSTTCRRSTSASRRAGEWHAGRRPARAALRQAPRAHGRARPVRPGRPRAAHARAGQVARGVRHARRGRHRERPPVRAARGAPATSSRRSSPLRHVLLERERRAARRRSSRARGLRAHRRRCSRRSSTTTPWTSGSSTKRLASCTAGYATRRRTPSRMHELAQRRSTKASAAGSCGTTRPSWSTTC